MKTTKEPNEKPLAFRIDSELNEQLDFFSDKRKTTKSEMVRMAVEDFMEELESGYDDAAIEDYLCGRIEPEQFLKEMEFKKIPEDLQKRRGKNLDEIAKNALEKTLDRKEK